MPSYHVSPMGDPTIAGAVSNLAQVFTGGGPQVRAKGELMGTQVRKTRAEADAREYQNQQISKLAEVFASNPQLAAILGAGQGNSQQMAGAVGAFQQQDFRRQAVDAAARGDYNAANAPLFGVASGPVSVNQIDGGYQLNPVQAGGPIQATGKTLAEIVTEGARANAQEANAAQSYASAGAARALEAQRRDQVANPEKYRAVGLGRGAGQPLDVSPQDTAALDKLVGTMAPSGAQFPDDVRNEVLTRAAQIYQQTRNAQQAVSQAMSEMTETTPAVDVPWYNIFSSDQPAKVGRKAAPAAPAGAAPQQAQAAPQEVRQLNGKTYVKINGQWFEQ